MPSQESIYHGLALRQQKWAGQKEEPCLCVCVWPECLSLRTSLHPPWAVPSCDVINWTRRRSRASSCASYMCLKACLRVTTRSTSLLLLLPEHLHFGLMCKHWTYLHVSLMSITVSSRCSVHILEQGYICRLDGFLHSSRVSDSFMTALIAKALHFTVTDFLIHLSS